MGYSNGTLYSKNDRATKGQKGDRGAGFSLTTDNHFHIRNKRLTNLSAPVDDSDATTRKFVVDSLKNKAGTTFVKAELNKKANREALKDYALISDLGTLAIEFNDALKDKVDHNDLANYSTTAETTKHYITIYAEENGSLIKNALQWSFGNGSENSSKYGWPSPAAGRIVRGSICAVARDRPAAEVRVIILVNGRDSDYEIAKRTGALSDWTIFPNPLEINAGDRINFRSRTTNSSVSHAMVNILIEIDVENDLSDQSDR